MKDLYYKLRDVPPIALWLCLVYISSIDTTTVNRYAFGVVLLSQLLRVWARRYIGAHSRGRDLEAPELIRNGPYSLSRNPLYIANILFGFGLILLVNNWGVEAIVVLFLFSLHYVVLAYVEEHFLRVTFPESYNEWSSNTPRFIGFRARYSGGFPKRSFFQAFKKDIWTWIFQIVMVVVLVIL